MKHATLFCPFEILKERMQWALHIRSCVEWHVRTVKMNVMCKSASQQRSQLTWKAGFIDKVTKMHYFCCSGTCSVFATVHGDEVSFIAQL